MVNRKRLVQTFLDLVKIDSVSSEEQKIAKELIKRLQKMGGKAGLDSYGNVIGKFSGTGEPIMLAAHMDTVEPGRRIKPKIKADQIISDGSTILGGDDKAGLAVILEALASLQEEKTKHLPLEIVFTRQEETGLLGAKNLDYSQLSAKRGINFDGEQVVNRIDISSVTYSTVNVTVTGRSAHAGLEPEKGISAIEIASHIISRLKLGRIDEQTTANIGIIEGGSVRNAVPEKAQFSGEIRSRDLKNLENHEIHFREVVEEVLVKYPGAEIELKIEKEVAGYLLPEDHHLIATITEVLKKMSLTPVFHHSGGLTDINIFRSHGIEMVNVGIGDHMPHTKREYVVIAEMLDSARFCELVTN